METTFPAHILLDAGTTVKELRDMGSDSRLPTLIVDAVLETLVELIGKHHDARAQMCYAGQEVLDLTDPVGDGLVAQCYDDESSDTINALDVATLKINRIGRELLDQVEQLKLFEEGGYLNYEYHDTINDHTLVLRRKRGVLHGS